MLVRVHRKLLFTSTAALTSSLSISLGQNDKREGNTLYKNQGNSLVDRKIIFFSAITIVSAKESDEVLGVRIL